MSRFKKELDKLWKETAAKKKKIDLKSPLDEKKIDPLSAKKITSEYLEKLRHAAFNKK